MNSLSEYILKIAIKLADFATFNSDGSVEIVLKDVPDEIWKRYSDAMRHLGYEYRGAQDAKELTQKSSKGKETVTLKDDHATAFRAAVGKKDLFKPQSGKKTIEKAVKEFGITENPSLAGYIIPDGRMLNFGEYGTRSKDHREIGVVLPEADNLRGHEAIEAFCKLGNIRLLMSNNSINFDIHVRPTDAQYDTMEDILYRHNKDKTPVFVDMPGHHREFESPDPDDVMGFIKGRVQTAANAFKSWGAIRDAYEQQGLHHCLKLLCAVCGDQMTCRCSTPKTEETGVCPSCSGQRLGRYVREEGKGTPGQPGYKPTLWYWITPDGKKKLVDQKTEE